MNEGMIRVLGRATSGNVQKVVWLLEELGLEYAREDYGRQFGNTQEPAYLSLNPNGKVPTLVDGDVVIWESNTILRYLASKAGSDFYPADIARRSAIERWMDWQLASLNGPYLTIFKASKKEPEERAAAMQGADKELGQMLTILEGGLNGKAYLAGDDISVADFCLGPIVNRCVNFPVELPDLPSVRLWLQSLAKRDAFQKIVA